MSRELSARYLMTLTKLAGVPRPTWANLESGAANPTVSVLRRAAAYLSQANLKLGQSPKWTYPLVRDLAADGIPVTVTCRVLKVSTQAFYAWCANPVSGRDLVDAYAMNAAFEVHRDDPRFGYRFIAEELAALGAEVHMVARSAEQPAEVKSAIERLQVADHRDRAVDARHFEPQRQVEGRTRAQRQGPGVLPEALEARPQLVGPDSQIREAETPLGVGRRLDRHVRGGLASRDDRAGHCRALRVEDPAADAGLVDRFLRVNTARDDKHAQHHGQRTH